jgi:branched-chain amino acid transport system ATP-binding protein
VSPKRAKRRPRRPNGAAGVKAPKELIEKATVPADIVTGKSEDQTRFGDVLARGRQSFRDTIREAADYRAIARSKYGLVPVIVLLIASAVTALDSRIFTLAIPVIVPELDFDLPALISILSAVGFVTAIGIVFFSYLTDRVRRVPFVAGGTIVTGLASIVTGRISNTRGFGLTRIADSIGSDAIDVPVGSLTADYYPVEIRGKVYALLGVVKRLFSVGAPLIVGVALIYISWRTMYAITGSLLVLAGILSLVFLKEPIRGYMERRSLGVEEEEAQIPEPPLSFGAAWRTVWSIRTYRRLFMSDIPSAVGDFAFGIFLPVWAFEHYGLSPLQLGLIFALISAVVLPFGFLSGGIIDQLVRYRPSRVLTFTGMLSLFSVPAVIVIGLGPPLWVFATIFMVFNCANALVGPARGVLYAQIVPANTRGLGFNVRVIAEIPAALIRGTFIAFFVRKYGTAGGIYVCAPFFLVSALIELSAAGFFDRDMRRSLASQLAASDWRRAKEEGRDKMLVCRNVDVEYSGIQVLFDVDFDVEEGQIIALLGTNGAGKSTLLKAIAGVQEASGGAVVMDGRDITHVPPNEIAQKGVMLMPGGRGTFPDLTVAENLVLGNWLNDDEKRLEEIYEMFPILKTREQERAQLLSGGEQQMLSLAMAFLSKPKLLMIDELSLGLSPAAVQQLIEVVRQIHKEGTTIIVVEQSVNIALTIAEQAVFMEKGEVKFVGKTADLLKRPDILRAVYVKGTGALVDRPASGRKSERDLREYGLEHARPIVEVKNLTKLFGGVVAVNDVSFDLRDGESLGLIGPNGAGKTTVFDLVSGFQSPDSGQVMFDGVEVTSMGPEERSRAGMVRRFQDARLFPSLTVYENILAALERRLEVRSMVLTAIQAPQARRAERRARARADRLIELLELEAYRDKFAKELSTGLRRITDIACVLATEPRVLLLDEPSTGIAQAEAESLGPLLRRARHETGCSMLIIEHDMTLIATLSDELIAMDQGAVVVRGKPEVVLNDDRVIESYLGTSEDVIKRTGARA